MLSEDVLLLEARPHAVPGARQFARRVLAGTSAEPLAVDVELVVSELVTNALFHGTPPVTLAVGVRDHCVRVEVSDSSRTVPVRPLGGQESMTGRGLALVGAVTRQWGVDALPKGKVVWAEIAVGEAEGGPLSEEPDLDVDALLAAWGSDDDDTERLYMIALGDVPTDLLLAAKAHVDNLVREFALASSGAVSGTSAAVPLPLAELIEAVVHRFADARQSIKRQAIKAANNGEQRTSLTLQLSPRSIEAGRAYLDALDEADNYARAARLLTLETPPQHRVFRRWYVESLVEQLSAATRGDLPPRCASFEERLLEELGTLAAAKRVADRTARLQTVTAALARATTMAQVADVVVGEGVSALGADGGSLLTPEDDHLTVAGAVGYSATLVASLGSERADSPLPSAVAMRSGNAVWVESPQERDELFPSLAAVEPLTAALCAVPLLLNDQIVGVLRFSFATARLFDADERRFIEALAAQTAQAVVRSSLYAAESRARHMAEATSDRLSRLHDATAAFGVATSVEGIADILVTHAADALGAGYASLWLVHGDELRVVRSRGLDEETTQRWLRVPLAASIPLSEAVRTGETVVIGPGDDIAGMYHDLGETPGSPTEIFVNVPLALAGEPLGGISLSFPVGHDLDQRSGLRFLRTLADACAQAIARTRAQVAARVANERLSFLADASGVLSSSLDYRATLRTIADLVVPRIADWCSVQIVENGEFVTVAVAHVDPEKVAAALEFQRRYPTEADAPTGAPNVVRTGASELVPEVTEEMISGAVLDEEQAAFVRWLGLSSILTVPLTGRSGTFGALTLVYSESGRHYDESDVSFVEDLARRCAIAVENAEAFSAQSGQLMRVSRVAEVTQHAILPPVPPRIGSVRLATRYVSATREALIGGDLYEVAERDGVVRLIVGDVRGKGVDAVRLATVVLGEFRSAAARFDDLVTIATHMDERVSSYIGDEDFVTALLVEMRSDGTCAVVSCGHPHAYVTTGAELSLIEAPAALPLGLGSRPEALAVQLPAGARVLLYTDGLVEARDSTGGFVNATGIVAPMLTAPFDDVLDAILERLQVAAGSGVSDDLALLLAEFDPA